MKLIVCVDDRMGMAFNRRRQSRDRILCEDISKMTEGAVVGMDPRSAMLFEHLSMNIRTDGTLEGCDYVFLEFSPPSKIAEPPEEIILYRWNRHYPADVRFDLSLDAYTCRETVEFAGSSHETITREVYINE